MAGSTRVRGTPTGRAARDEAAGLTPREAEIVRLVAAGLPVEVSPAAASARDLN